MTEEKALTVQTSLDDTMRLGSVMAESGFFADAKQAAQAVVKILAGQEIGFGPVASMTGVHIIQNKPSIGANLIAAKVKGHPAYDYRVTRMDETGCEIAFFQNGQEIGRSLFTMDDAKRAGLTNKDNWKRYPKNLLFARAISNGARWYCPDVFSGVTVYTPEELGAEVDEGGEIIDVTPEPRERPGEIVQAGEDKPEQATETNGPTITSPNDLLIHVNNATTGYYNHVKHMLGAIKKHTGNDDYRWPSPDDPEGYNVAFTMLCEYAEAQTASKE